VRGARRRRMIQGSGMTLFALTWLLSFLASFAVVFYAVRRLGKTGYPRRRLSYLLLVLLGVVFGAFGLIEVLAERIGPVAEVTGEVIHVSHARGRYADAYRVTVSGEPPVTVKSLGRSIRPTPAG